MKNKEICFSELPESMRANKDLLLMAISGTHEGFLIHYASEELQNNEELAIIALENHIDCDEHVLIHNFSKTVRDNQNFAKRAIELQPFNIEYVSDRLKDDEELIRTAISKHTHTLYYASPRLKDNEDIVLTAIEKNGWALEFASDRLKDDERIVLEALKFDKRTLRYASERIQNLYKCKWIDPIKLIEDYLHKQNK